ncbi:MAG: hypothetical protein ABSC55_05020 [Syntrophorhabdales bacterium]|jgi:hypothetical protein
MAAVASRPGKSPHTLIIMLAGLLLVSCAHLPPEPQKGDVRVIDGVEYVYGKNPKYMNSQIEPLYVWLRKDQYSPDTLDDFTFRSPVPTEKQNEMEARIAKIEAELKKTQVPQQVSPPPPQPVLAPPTGTSSMASLPKTKPEFPSLSKMKRRVLVLPITGATDLKYEQVAGLVTERLVANLERTGMIICLDPRAVGFRGNVTQPGIMKDLEELHGIQAVVQGSLFNTPAVSTTGISLTVYNAETGLILRQLSSKATLLTREQGVASDMDRIRAIDLGIEPIAEDALKSILALDWHARIASTEQGKILINAGKLSGLEKGDTLEVYAPGEQITDAATKMPLGKLKGAYKGEIEVTEFSGEDESWARSRKGEKFSSTDLVYLKR